MEMMEESKGCSEKEEEEEEDHFMVRDERFSRQDAASINSNGKLDLMDLSLGNKDMDEAAAFIPGGGGDCSTSAIGLNACSSSGHESIEKEHMFDKVVTPSDVGKLNRLVIPKQHAEKYFPLCSSSNEKGLLLNFEDRNGKSWKFRYSYWNSSQSYVMTKGWSRFVKEKKLDAGDIVSFQRGVGDLHKHCLYIDWRRRPDHHHPHTADHQTTGLISPLLIPNQTPLPQFSIRWSGRLYSLPQPLSISRQHHEHMQQQMNCNFHRYYHHHHQQQQHLNYHHDIYGSGHQHFNEVYLSSPASTSLQNQAVRQDGGRASMVIDSVPVGHHSGKAAAKKFRLFGVNMEYSPSPDEEPRSRHILSSTVQPSHANATMATNSVLPPHLPSSSLSSLQLRLPPGAAMLSYSQGRFQDKKESSLPFVLDPSMPYFQ